MTEMIAAAALRKSFRARGREVEAVRGVSFAVAPGEIFGFLGPNGAGKTTTLRMLATLLPIDAGTAAVAGFDVAPELADVADSRAIRCTPASRSCSCCSTSPVSPTGA